MIPYVVPFVLYLVLIQTSAAFPDHYAWLYPALVTLAGAATVALLHGRQVIRPHRHVWAGVAVGLVGIVFWIVLSQLKLEQAVADSLPTWLQPSARVGFDPFREISRPAAFWTFLAARLAGLVLLVPVAEELFWRGFLLRWLISADWENQELGRFTPFSFLGVTLLFTLIHPEWLAAAVYCSLLNGLIYWKRDIWNCIVAHGVSNAVLAAYILYTGAWELW
jgi:uncharacterized protein